MVNNYNIEIKCIKKQQNIACIGSKQEIKFVISFYQGILSYFSIY